MRIIKPWKLTKATRPAIEQRLGKAVRRYRAPDETQIVVPVQMGRKYLQVIGFRNGRLRLFRIPKSEAKFIGPVGGGSVVGYSKMGATLLRLAERSPPNVTGALWRVSISSEDVL